MNLGAQTLHHQARLERVVQVCHPDTAAARPATAAFPTLRELGQAKLTGALPA